jgi:hypothetical protein
VSVTPEQQLPPGVFKIVQPVRNILHFYGIDPPVEWPAIRVQYDKQTELLRVEYRMRDPYGKDTRATVTVTCTPDDVLLSRRVIGVKVDSIYVGGDLRHIHWYLRTVDWPDTTPTRKPRHATALLADSQYQ